MNIDLDKEFEDYVKRVYLSTIDTVQHKECKQAFMAGIIFVMDTYIKIGNDDSITEEKAAEILETIIKQIIEYTAKRKIEQLKKHTN